MNSRSWVLVAASLLWTVSSCAAPTGDDEEETLSESDENALSAPGGASAAAGKMVTPDLSASERADVLSHYTNIDPDDVVPKSLRDDAIVYYDTNKDNLPNDKYLTVVDFSKASGKHRFFVMNMKTGKVSGIVVAHGSGSDPDNDGLPTKFSNVPNSNASSLGYYLTAETYTGNHGRSLRMDGLSTTNSNVRSRAVVIHGADYVSEGRAKQGRSWGCFALAQSAKDSIIDQLKGGSLIFAGRSGS